jgi:hypothetical protein
VVDPVAHLRNHPNAGDLPSLPWSCRCRMLLYETDREGRQTIALRFPPPGNEVLEVWEMPDGSTWNGYGTDVDFLNPTSEVSGRDLEEVIERLLSRDALEDLRRRAVVKGIIES